MILTDFTMDMQMTKRRAEDVSQAGKRNGARDNDEVMRIDVALFWYFIIFLPKIDPMC